MFSLATMWLYQEVVSNLVNTLYAMRVTSKQSVIHHVRGAVMMSLTACEHFRNA